MPYMPHQEFEENYFEMDPNFQFNTAINELLNQEVEKRVSEKVKDYEQAKERDASSQKTISDLRNQMHKLQMELKGAENTFKKEGAGQAKREMLGGFKLGDEAWFVRSQYNSETCTVCSGDKKLVVEIQGEERKVKCPECNGFGCRSKLIKSAEKGLVKEIDIHTWAQGKQLSVKMYIEPTSYRASSNVQAHLGGFFKTKEECEKELNKEKP
ncbi:hypothetical protein BK764_14165 [Bacillus thuringiensis serovar israelensis]|uniref:Uncharacterized protein n=5 Tax=Bacillaceae TaxID=186817 RepID=A0AB35PBA4_BACTU|nr:MULTISPECIES: hypothetical protein [Bacillus]AFQ30396.1 hypothetical protein BTF1_31482 [Bacillus thuringiensis HD-789]AJH02394.1 hypothetical protein AS86_6660 [Bacillus thuringiensis HD1002]EEM99427.1 hypothetical protein bthur0014_59330 [Bacillus thuringiensis IBL 4222]KRD76657.1 hypothetical protein ASE53_20440 [Bacillus sp. Root11]OTX79107.1 hypothetical protein BK719_02540 [Bacillus thuringiensis serovar novosibirsk]RCX38565.1 hypothetical protein DEU45_10655 [Bacillus sp. AG102]